MLNVVVQSVIMLNVVAPFFIKIIFLCKMIKFFAASDSANDDAALTAPATGKKSPGAITFSCRIFSHLATEQPIWSNRSKY
jgi:hypothetical protein